jgi:putative tricarboxylic transport membrane protein
MRKAEIITAFILGLFSLSIMWKSGEGPSWDPDVSRFDNIGFIDGEGPGSGFWPFWLSLVSEKPFLDATGVRLVLEVSGGLIGFLLLIFVVGFYAAMFVFLIYYIKILGKHRWKTTLLISSGIPVFCFFFFDIAMRIILPKGYLEPLFIPLYDIFL